MYYFIAVTKMQAKSVFLKVFNYSLAMKTSKTHAEKLSFRSSSALRDIDFLDGCTQADTTTFEWPKQNLLRPNSKASFRHSAFQRRVLLCTIGSHAL